MSSLIKTDPLVTFEEVSVCKFWTFYSLSKRFSPFFIVKFCLCPCFTYVPTFLELHGVRDVFTCTLHKHSCCHRSWTSRNTKYPSPEVLLSGLSNPVNPPPQLSFLPGLVDGPVPCSPVRTEHEHLLNDVLLPQPVHLASKRIPSLDHPVDQQRPVVCEQRRRRPWTSKSKGVTENPIVAPLTHFSKTFVRHNRTVEKVFRL